MTSQFRKIPYRFAYYPNFKKKKSQISESALSITIFQSKNVQYATSNHPFITTST